MNRERNLFRFNPLRGWPLWLKTYVGVFAAMFFPTLTLLVLIAARSEQINAEATRSYLQSLGQSINEELSEDLGFAIENLDGALESSLLNTQMLSLLRSLATDNARNAVEDFLENRLVRTGLYQDIRVLTPTGIVALDTGTLETGTDVSQDDVGYRAARNAQLLNEPEEIILYNDGGTLRLEIVKLLYNNRLELVGFLVGTLDIDELLIENLETEDGLLESIAYLRSRDNLIITPRANRERAAQSAAVAPLQAALAGQSGLANYSINDDTIIGYYTPLLEGRFTLVVEQASSSSKVIPGITTFLASNALSWVIFILAGVLLAVMLANSLSRPLRSLRRSLSEMREGSFDTPVAVAPTADIIGRLARDFIALREQVRTTLRDQEERIAARTRDIEATQEVSRYAATQRNVTLLMDEVVNLIVAQFGNIYHAQIFLIDEQGHYAVLRASTGRAGRQLLARGHRLGVGSNSVIGRVTAQGRVVVATDTAKSDVHKRNEFLPDSRSELAIPLRIGDRIIGALDVQSTESNTFKDEQVQILQIMADQITISLDAARLYQESVQRLQSIEANNRSSTNAAWDDFLDDQRRSALVYQAGQDNHSDSAEALRLEAIKREDTVIGELTEHDTRPFAVPIRFRGSVLGAVYWELPNSTFSQNKVQLAEELVSRLAVTLDNARLFEETRRSVERERIVGDLAAQLSGKTDVKDILETAVRQVGQALQLPDVSIRLNLNGPATSNGHETNGHANHGQHPTAPTHPES